jgi:hypothetical protein
MRCWDPHVDKASGASTAGVPPTDAADHAAKSDATYASDAIDAIAPEDRPAQRFRNGRRAFPNPQFRRDAIRAIISRLKHA